MIPRWFSSRADSKTVVVGVGILVTFSLELHQLICAAILCLLYLLCHNSKFLASSRFWIHSPDVPKHFERDEDIDLSSIIGSQRLPSRPPLRQHSLSTSPIRQDSKVPVKPPSFEAVGLSAQVAELLAQITPSPESERVAQKLALHAEKFIREILPTAKVDGFVNGDVLRGTAFGVAVPEIDMVATVSYEALAEQLQGRLAKGGLVKTRVDERKLQKSAIRACTDQLVAAAGFKFRRSAFRCQEPKVTLMAPANLGVAEQGIPLDFSVNCVTPRYQSTLISTCWQLEPRSRDLVLLVRRWAKDRGVCHVARGHLPPYAWTLMALYYLQVGVAPSPLLPPLKGVDFCGEVKLCSTPFAGSAATHGTDASQLSIGDLFRGFIGFYRREIKWFQEAISVRTGRREVPSDELERHVVEHDDGSIEPAPLIEDPFDVSRNFGSSLSSEGLLRFREELSRAEALLGTLGEEVSLAEILEPWAPPETPVRSFIRNVDEDAKFLREPAFVSMSSD